MLASFPSGKGCLHAGGQAAGTAEAEISLQVEAHTISKEAAPQPVVPKAQKTPVPANQPAKVRHMSSAARHEGKNYVCRVLCPSKCPVTQSQAPDGRHCLQVTSPCWQQGITGNGLSRQPLPQAQLPAASAVLPIPSLDTTRVARVTPSTGFRPVSAQQTTRTCPPLFRPLDQVSLLVTIPGKNVSRILASVRCAS